MIRNIPGSLVALMLASPFWVSSAQAEENAVVSMLCDSGDLLACFGVLLLEFNEKPKEALKPLTTKCKEGVGAACIDAGVLLVTTPTDKDSPSQAQLFFSNACTRNAARGCFNAGLMSEYGIGAEQSYSQALRNYKAGCLGGYDASCVFWGRYLEIGLGSGGVPYLIKALQQYEKACAGKVGFGCWAIGDHWRRQVDGDPKARSFFRQGCQYGQMSACNNFGYMAALGQGGPVEAVEAHSSLDRSCKRGNAKACSNLGVMAEYGGVSKPNVETARALYEQSCAMGNALACHNLGASLELGALDGSQSAARQAYSRACAAGQVASCFRAGLLWTWDFRYRLDQVATALVVKERCKDGKAEYCHMLDLFSSLRRQLVDAGPPASK